MVNFLPKTASASDAFGGRSARSPMRSYSKRNATAQISTCRSLWRRPMGGLHAYGELDDSFSFYRGIHPSHQLIRV